MNRSKEEGEQLPAKLCTGDPPLGTPLVQGNTFMLVQFTLVKKNCTVG